MEDLSHLVNKIKVYPIVAMSTNGVIGKENKLPWPKCKEDLKRFKELTTNNVVIMGRKTHESIGKVLPNRINIVVTSSVKEDVLAKNDELYLCSNLSSALLLANRFNKKIFIIGGGTIYKQTIPLWDELYLTIINKEILDGDTFFLDRRDWKHYIQTNRLEDNETNEEYLQLVKNVIVITDDDYINNQLITTTEIIERRKDKKLPIFKLKEFYIAEDKSYSFQTLKIIKTDEDKNSN